MRISFSWFLPPSSIEGWIIFEKENILCASTAQLGNKFTKERIFFFPLEKEENIFHYPVVFLVGEIAESIWCLILLYICRNWSNSPTNYLLPSLDVIWTKDCLKCNQVPKHVPKTHRGTLIGTLNMSTPSHTPTLFGKFSWKKEQRRI